MKRLNLRAVLIALVALVALGGFVAERLSSSSPDAGAVTLVVDFGDGSGRPALEKQVDAFAGTGWQLFAAAGIAPEGTADYPASFVCRIQGWPSTSVESCLGTPNPANGYWKYFVASSELGGRWMMSGFGAAGHHPACGSAEGWLWVTPSTPVGAVPSIQPRVSKCE